LVGAVAEFVVEDEPTIDNSPTVQARSRSIGRSSNLWNRVRHAPFYRNTISRKRYPIQSKKLSTARNTKLRAGRIVCHLMGSGFYRPTEGDTIIPCQFWEIVRHHVIRLEIGKPREREHSMLIEAPTTIGQPERSQHPL
jgi:hypothetical protein